MHFVDRGVQANGKLYFSDAAERLEGWGIL